jgi:hypothetical protein
MRSTLLERPVEVQEGTAAVPAAVFGTELRRLERHTVHPALPQALALDPLSSFVCMREGPAEERTAPHERDLQLVAVPSFFSLLALCTQ